MGILSYLCPVFTAFKNHIENTYPQLLNEPGIIACSGGVDSVVLTHLSVQLGMNVALAHCNFKLRGEESEADERFVKRLAENFNIPYFTTSFETEKYLAENKFSTQMAARELRYTWFFELISTKEFSWVLTAHHMDDSLETFLINLSRGTGIEGLTGIPANNNDIYRPLLPFSRDEILEYARDNNLEWREDSTNQETKYLRNKIRHEVIPPLKELHPTFIENFAKTQNYLSETAQIAAQHIIDLKTRLFEPYHRGFKIPLGDLEKLRPLKGYLYGFFKEYGFTSWKDIETLLSAMSGKEVRSKTHKLIKDRKYLILQVLDNKDEVLHEENNALEQGDLPIDLTIEKVDRIEEKNNTILYVDKETLNQRLTVRKWKKGDYFYPLGMDGRKKVAKFFKDEKMDAVAKENQWLLCSGEDIVWIISRRADDRFKITPNTKTILKITLAE